MVARRARPASRCRSCWRCRRWRRSGRRRPRPGRPRRAPSADAAATSAISAVRDAVAARSSHAVSRAPCRTGRVSSDPARATLPCACAARTTPSAVPYPAVARAPALQWVRMRAFGGTSARAVGAHRAIGGDVLRRAIAWASASRRAPAVERQRARRGDCRRIRSSAQKRLHRGRPRRARSPLMAVSRSASRPSKRRRLARARRQHHAEGRRHADRRAPREPPASGSPRRPPASSGSRARSRARAARSGRRGSAGRFPSGRARCRSRRPRRSRRDAQASSDLGVGRVATSTIFSRAWRPWTTWMDDGDTPSARASSRATAAFARAVDGRSRDAQSQGGVPPADDLVTRGARLDAERQPGRLSSCRRPCPRRSPRTSCGSSSRASRESPR